MAGGAPATGKVLALADGFMKGMLMSKLKSLAVVFLVLTLSAGAGVGIQLTLAGLGPAYQDPFSAAARAVEEDEPAKAAADAARTRPEIKTVANRVWTVMEVVAKRHLEPCPQKDMISAGVTSLCLAAKSAVPSNLADRAAAVASLDQFTTLLADLWPQTTATPRDKLEKALLDSVLGCIPGKPHLTVPPSQKEIKVQEQISGNRYVGIGIQLKKQDDEKNPPEVITVMRGGAARAAGIKAGDCIESVNGKATQGVPLAQVVDWLRGEEGTTVTLTVRRAQETKPRSYTMTRAKVTFEHVVGLRRISEDSCDYHADAKSPIAYVRITSLASSTLHELRQTERKLQGAGFRAVVLDLRFGSQGSFAHAALVCGGLLDGGLMWTTRSGETRQEFRAGRECLFRGWPLVVLIDGSSDTSGSLIAAALQDHGRAVLVGEPTNTEGYLNSMVELPGQADALVLPTGRLERSNATRGWPLKPDHVVPMEVKQRKTCAAWATAQTITDRPIDPKAKPPADPQLTKAVELLREALKRLASSKDS
jgi:carboxyl-terminal processing protease